MAQYNQNNFNMVSSTPNFLGQPDSDPQDQTRIDNQTSSRSNTPLFRNNEALKNGISGIKRQKPVIDTSNPNIASDSQINSFFLALERIVSTSELSADQRITLVLGVCELFQKGAVSPKFDKSRKSQLFTGNLTVAQIQDAARSIDRNLTLRKIARGLKDTIIEVAREWSIPGNLAKKYSQHNPNATISELIWASDFFTDRKSVV